MSSSATSSSPAAGGIPNPKQRRALGFFANAIKHKDSFIQFFAMTGILLLSIRSLGQKYRINDLNEDTSALKQEHQSLLDRKSTLKRTLLDEAASDPTGVFASRLRHLFADEQ